MDYDGIVREFNVIKGIGVIDSAHTPGGCWVHSGAIRAEGLRNLTPGGRVKFSFTDQGQDGFDYRALEVHPEGVTTERTLEEINNKDSASGAYTSSLTIDTD